MPASLSASWTTTSRTPAGRSRSAPIAKRSASVADLMIIASAAQQSRAGSSRLLRRSAPRNDGSLVSATPLTADEFAAALDAIGGFEAQPCIAIAVSGGSDSLALALLADDWARRRGGQATALTVDHGL